MGNKVLDLHTDQALLRALADSVKKSQSPEQRKEQRVSFVYGSLDSDSSITRERVREILAKEGVAA